MAERFASHHTGIVDEELDGEVVGAIHHKVILLHQVEGIVCHQELTVGFHFHVWIDGIDGLLGRLHLPLIHIGRGVDDLSLQVAQIHHIAIHNADGAHTSRCQIHCHRGTQSACTHDEHTSFSYLFLSFHAHVLQEDMARIAVQFFFCKIKHNFIYNLTIYYLQLIEFTIYHVQCTICHAACAHCVSLNCTL